MPQPIAFSDIKPNPLAGFATIDFDALVLDGFHVVLAFRTNHRISFRRRTLPEKPHSGSLRKDLPAGDVWLVALHANFHKYPSFDA